MRYFMTGTVIVALISFAGTVFGTFGGIIASSKLTNYRIEQLEKKVDTHNNFAHRIPLIEQKIENTYERLENLEKRI